MSQKVTDWHGINLEEATPDNSNVFEKLTESDTAYVARDNDGVAVEVWSLVGGYYYLMCEDGWDVTEEIVQEAEVKQAIAEMEDKANGTLEEKTNNLPFPA